MSNQQPTTRTLINRIDQAIRGRILETDEFDSLGNPVAAIPASDKLGLAKKTGAQIEDVEQRLNVICEEVVEEERFEAVPRYRLRGDTPISTG
jgi:hypothetical protein